MKAAFDALGRRVAAYLLAPRRPGALMATVRPERLAEVLRPGDVLLVEGHTRVSGPIKYMTQSNWSHAALYVGPIRTDAAPGAEPRLLIEADLLDGVRAVPLSVHAHLHTRICRPVGLTPAEVERLVAAATACLGRRYDLRNLFDLGRYLLPLPHLPVHWRRRALALGSGDPSRAICSTLIAELFQSLRYPMLPIVGAEDMADTARDRHRREVLHIRDHRLYAPRDFDISPSFEIVKPALQEDFDYHRLAWGAGEP